MHLIYSALATVAVWPGDLISHRVSVPGPPRLLPPRRISECCPGRRPRGRWGAAWPASPCPSSSSTWRTPAPALRRNQGKQTGVSVSQGWEPMLCVRDQLTSTPLKLRFEWCMMDAAGLSPAFPTGELERLSSGWQAAETFIATAAALPLHVELRRSYSLMRWFHDYISHRIAK